MKPPSAAIRLLTAALPPGERDAIVGDLSEIYADRVEARRPFNRVWFWSQALGFLVAAGPRPFADLSSRRHRMERFTTRVRQTARRLAGDWRYSAGVIAILAVGIGPAAAMLSVVDKVLLRPLDYREPERLGLIRLDLGQLKGHPGISPAEAINLRRSAIFDSVETQTRRTEVSVGPPENMIALSQITFTTGMLPMLGVSPIVGRSFTEEDFVPNGPLRVMLDYRAWQTHFGGARDIAGRKIQLNGRPAEVAGVLPNGFRIATGRAVPIPTDVYLPFRLTDFRNAWQFPTIVRLKPGTTYAQAQAGLDVLATQLKRQYPDVYDTTVRFTVAPLLDDMTKTTRPALRAAVAGVLLLLVIAFTNATAIIVARLRARAHDVAIRAALGASRGALVAEALIESTELALAGAAAGSLVAVAAVAGIRQVIPHTVPRWEQIGVGWEVVVYAGVLALGGLIISGLVPVWKVSRASWQTLRAGSVQGGRAEGALSRLVLVGAQIALTVVLAFGSVQLTRSAARLRQVDLGFDPAVLTLRVPFENRRFDTNPKRIEMYQRLRDRVRAVPGVAAAGLVSHVPLSGSTMTDGFQADMSKAASFDQSVANYQAVTPGYFATLRIPILDGRDFTDQEDRQSRPVIVVDETLARTAFPGARSVVGRTLKLGWGIPDSQIVGVVGHVRAIEVGREVRPQIYAPAGQLFQPAMILTVRAEGDPMRLLGAIEAAVREIGPGRATSAAAMLAGNVAAATSTLRAVTGLVSFLALSAGLLSAIGLYLVIAFVVHQQRRETAIRAALGASRRQVVWQHGKTSAVVLAAALPAGVLLSLAIAPLFADLVYGIGRHDPGSLALALVVATIAGVLGTLIPVSRVTTANVATLLRGD